MNSQFIHHLFLCLTIQATLYFNADQMGLTHKRTHQMYANPYTAERLKLQQYGYGDAQKRHTIRVTAAQNQKTNECKAYATHCALKQNLIFVIHSSHLPLWNNLLFFPLSSWTCEMLLRCVHICDSERKEQEKNTKDDNDNKKRNLFTHHTIGSIIFMVLHAQQNWTFFPSFIQSFSSIPFRLCGARSMDSKRIHVYLWHMCMLSVCDIFHSFKINIGIKLS